MVAVLFARADSHYKQIPGCDVWDEVRDGRLWPGGQSVVAHPPCRAWGRYAHKANAPAHEKDLARFSVAMVRRWGGVLEHPANSGLWADQGLPAPGRRDGHGGHTVAVLQKWWGHEAEKPTWLYIIGCAPGGLPPVPITLRAASNTIENMCRQKRERTPFDFAVWLCDLARRVRL